VRSPRDKDSKELEDIMKRLTMLMVAIALTVSLAAVAAAQAGPRDFGRRGVRQELRIRRGVRAGQLTRGEAFRLRLGERRLHVLQRRAWADGRFGPCERCRLNHAYDRQSFRIWRLRHNGRVI
jgi:hypothetical protein